MQVVKYEFNMQKKCKLVYEAKISPEKVKNFFKAIAG